MSRAAQRARDRLQGIDARMRARRIAGWQRQQRFARMSAAQRAAHAAMLAQLAGQVEAGGFDPDFVRQAHAALLQGNPVSPQGSLSLRGRSA